MLIDREPLVRGLRLFHIRNVVHLVRALSGLSGAKMVQDLGDQRVWNVFNRLFVP